MPLALPTHAMPASLALISWMDHRRGKLGGGGGAQTSSRVSQEAVCAVAPPLPTCGNLAELLVLSEWQGIHGKREGFLHKDDMRWLIQVTCVYRMGNLYQTSF